MLCIDSELNVNSITGNTKKTHHLKSKNNSKFLSIVKNFNNF